MAPLHLRGADAAERRRYAELIRPARLRAGLSQVALADLADVDRTTVSNVERGAGAPQEDVLRRIFLALGLAVDGEESDPEIELWLSIMGELLATVPHDRRHFAADAAIATLAAHVRAGSETSSAVPATVRPDRRELERRAEERGIAARHGRARRDEPHGD